jgi:hypothetical protein
MKLSVQVEDADDLAGLGTDPPVTVDVAPVRARSSPYFTSPFFGAWPGGGSRTTGAGRRGWS